MLQIQTMFSPHKPGLSEPPVCLQVGLGSEGICAEADKESLLWSECLAQTNSKVSRDHIDVDGTLSVFFG